MVGEKGKKAVHYVYFVPKSPYGPNASDVQFMIATCFTGVLPRLIIIHGYTPSVNHHYDPEQ